MDIERKTVMDGLRGAIGNWPDYKVQLIAATWRDKGALEKEDLEEINALIKAKNGQHDTPEIADGGTEC